MIQRAFFLVLFLFCGFASEVPTVRSPWKLELVANTPAIRHPSVVCSASDGRVFVAEDPMDITVPADAKQGQIICFHPDGRRTVFAENLHAVFGMQYLEGKLYVLHNPRFTVFRDGGDRGEEPENIIESTNPNPWALDWNDHVPANFRLAMDGYFYMAVGDKGIFGATGRDGKKVYLHGGGILRLRPDGTGLEIYCTGVRNILDVALTSEDEIFTYDNTDEHDWMGRLTHMVQGGFYGYPHDFVPRRPYTLWMMHDFGGGAATGTFAYTEDALPGEFHDNLFLADFGKRQIFRVVIVREGGSFTVERYEEMFSDIPDDFRPVGIAPSANGKSIYICDWQHRDTKGTNEVGRLWRLDYTGHTEEQPRPAWYLPAALGRKFNATDLDLEHALQHPSKSVRLAAQRELIRRKSLETLQRVADKSATPGRWHAIWGLAALEKPIPPSASMDPATLRQTIRAARSGAEFLAHSDASVRFQAATAEGIRGGDVAPLIDRPKETDFFAQYAVFYALNRIGKNRATAWREIVNALERANIREPASFALRETWDATLLLELSRFVRDKSKDVSARAEALRLAAQMARKFPEWKGEWGAYHPALAPAPKKIQTWEGTVDSLNLLSEMISSPARELRLASYQAASSLEERSLTPLLRARFDDEPEEELRVAILQALTALRDEEASPLFARILGAPRSGLTIHAIRGSEFCDSFAVRTALKNLLARKINAAERAEAIRTLGMLREQSAALLIARDTLSDDRNVRAAAIRALGRIGGPDAMNALREALQQSDSETKRQALVALGQMKDSQIVPDLLKAWHAPETKDAALDALLNFPDMRAFDAYLDALGSSNPATRERSRKTLEPIKQQAWPAFQKQLPRFNPVVIAELRKVYPEMGDVTLTTSEKIVPTTADYARVALEKKGDAAKGKILFFDETGVACIRCHTINGKGNAVGPDLTNIGTQFPRKELIEAIITPSKSVREGYQQVRIETDDDEEFAGLIKGESASDVTILDGHALLHTIPKRKIKSRHQSELSLMPEGLHIGLTLEQFADLIAYLESLR